MAPSRPRLVCAAAALVASLAAGPLQPLAAQPPRFEPPVNSPEVDGDGNITFRIRAEKAEQVRLASPDLPDIDPGREMNRSEEGVWELTLPSDPGSYRYRFDVDGVPVADPANPLTSQSNANAWSLVHVAGEAWMDDRPVAHGAVAEVYYHSQALGRSRRMHVYTPPGYERGTQERYPVLYLLHGALDCDDSWSTVGRAGFIFDNLIAENLAKPMVVVMPAGHTGPFSFGRGGLPMKDFIRDFNEDIKPFIEAHYRIHTDRERTAIAGLSMGGAHTLGIAIPHLDEYAWIGVFSSGVFGLAGFGPPREGPSWEEEHLQQLTSEELKEGLRLVWFAIGEDDFLLETSRATVELLEKHEFDVVSLETEGGHTWINWREYLRQFSQQLFRDRDSAAAGAESSQAGGN